MSRYWAHLFALAAQCLVRTWESWVPSEFSTWVSWQPGPALCCLVSWTGYQVGNFSLASQLSSGRSKLLVTRDSLQVKSFYCKNWNKLSQKDFAIFSHFLDDCEGVSWPRSHHVCNSGGFLWLGTHFWPLDRRDPLPGRGLHTTLRRSRINLDLCSMCHFFRPTR